MLTSSLTPFADDSNSSYPTTIHPSSDNNNYNAVAIAVPVSLGLAAIIASVIVIWCCWRRGCFQNGCCSKCRTNTSNGNQHYEETMTTVVVPAPTVSRGTMDKPFVRYALRETESEYRKVVKHMAEHGGSPWIKNIIEICKIENNLLWSQYQTSKRNMYDQGNPQGILNEQELYHGTSKDSLDNIYCGGFNRNYKGKNATHYGDGTYFARNFSYSASDTYSPPDEHGIKYVFLCQVLTGYYTLGRKGMKEPPFRPDKEIRFDSVVEKMPSPTMFVIFRDFHVFPSYVISFTK